ncbi:hypothetical protein [Streptomyces sp. NPDC053560]|uniref:hypothetical protein n=1 Tax=Streptomyces sp. NPDC053560 TaxID=3365711 RepID=UPI0037D3860D
MGSEGKLAISLAGLGHLASQLRSIKRRMDDTGNFKRQLGHDELGASRAFDALQGFLDGWKDGRKEIDNGVDAVAKQAGEIVEKFTKLDLDLKNQLEKGRK